MDNTDGVADLHMHTVASDGTCSVDERVYQAQQRDLDAIAITDHDSVSIDLRDRSVVADDLELIAGVEVRADVLDTKVELLGYFIDPEDEQLTDVLEEVRTYRRERNRQIIDRLQEISHLDRSHADIRAEADGILARPHVANVLIEEEIVDSIDEAFNEFLADDGKAFVPMERVPAPDVIDAIQNASGVVSLAHPGRIRTDNVESIVEKLVEDGLDGIEVQYPYDEAPSEGYADVSVEDAAALADKFRILKTGGSDCHGPGSGKFRIGEVRVPEEQLESLRERADQRRSL